MLAVALLPLCVPSAELIQPAARTGLQLAASICACSTLERPRLVLRGGVDQAQDQMARESRMQNALSRLKGITCELQRAADEGEDKEEVMHTSWGQPLSMNPVNAIVYNPDDYSDESEDAQEAFEKKRDRLAPTAENIESAMYKVEWMQDVADRLSPENVIAGLEKRGKKLEDLQPRMYPSGKQMGNLTAILETRERMYAKIKQIHATKDKLVHEMSKKAPVEELNEEIAGMRERGEVNPYIKLLHQWQKDHELERTSGSLALQEAAHKAVALPAGAVRSEPVYSGPVAIVTDERSRFNQPGDDIGE